MKISFRTAIVLSFPATLLVGGVAIAQTPTTKRVSVDSGGAQSNDESFEPSISADGRYVAFFSPASNLVLGDTNGTYDVFVHDRQLGLTDRVSINSGGAQGNGPSLYPSISADGRYVAFHGDATNLVSGDSNGAYDVFVHDRQLGLTERVSADSSGGQGNGFSLYPSISADGRFVTFESFASNLVPGDTNGGFDVFVRDRQLGLTDRVSVDSGGAESNDESFEPSISADGRYVAFFSPASNLVLGDTNGTDDVFVHDRQIGLTDRVSIDSGGTQGNGPSFAPSISADGRYVAFHSSANNLTPGDTNGAYDVFVHDRQLGVTERVSANAGGVQGNANSTYASISADGRYVAFNSYANNLVLGDTNGAYDVFVHDRQLLLTERVSVDSGGAQGNGSSFYPSISSISAAGRFVVFDSYANNLIPGDTNAASDVFARDRGPRYPSVYCTAGTTTNGCGASISASANPSLSLGNSCAITVTQIDSQKSGLLFYGIDNASFALAPWGPGSTSFLCVKQPTQRTPIQNSAGTPNLCDGSYLLDWNAYQSAHPLALGNPWSVGDKVYAQAWFRDPLAVKSTNLSDALEMTYDP